MCGPPAPPAAASGVSGFSATECNVTVAHSKIECTTAPGVGADLYWRVSLGGQASALDAADAVELIISDGVEAAMRRYNIKQ